MKQYSLDDLAKMFLMFMCVPVLLISCIDQNLTSQAPQAPPLSIQFKSFYDTSDVRFINPMWFGEYPAKTSSFLVGQLNGDLFLLEPVSGNEYKSIPAGHVPVTEEIGNDGLLGLAFHPNFLRNRKYYVFYNPAGGQRLLEERMMDSSFKTDAGYSRKILSIDSGTYGHNGGDIHFGKDGYLYAAIGDGVFTSPGVETGASQDLHSFYGKMIRIDVDHPQGKLSYSIPADNPFSTSSDTLLRKEIYAYGFRNPWRWSFEPTDGGLLLADVGNGVQEEVDLVVKGGNYGWRTMEGTTCFNDSDETTPLHDCDTNSIAPIATYPHTEVLSCIIGGYVFRGNTTSPLYNAYIFGDYYTRKLYMLKDRGLSDAGTAPANISSFGTDSQGNLYLVGYNNGVIYRLDPLDSPNQSP